MPEAPYRKAREHPAKKGAGVAASAQRAGSCASSPRIRYAELAVSSNFSFLRGASHADELVDRAAELGLGAISCADLNTLAGIVRAHVAAKQAGIPLVVGARVRLIEPREMDALVYATDRASYARLCLMLTRGKRRAEKGECLLAAHDLIEFAEGSGLLGVVVPPEGGASYGLDDQFVQIVEGLRDRGFGGTREDRLSIAASRLYGADDESRLRRIGALCEHTRVPMVATNDVHYHAPERRALQDVLTCIRHGCTLWEAGFRLFPNGERFLKPPEEMARLFARWPRAIGRTVEIADRAADFSLDELRYQYPEEVVPTGRTAKEHLRFLTEEGARGRYRDGVPAKVRAQIEHELGLIGELRYEAYFLTVHDLVREARSRGILCQGRGAAANSAVCYCLGVTSVDPDRIDVLFERFVSRERDEPPDIDIDFEHERREEVIQYVYGKYGRDRAALVAEVISYRGRSAVRDVGKVLGLSLDCVDALAKNLDLWGEMAEGTEARPPRQHEGTKEGKGGKPEGIGRSPGEVGERRLREVGLAPGTPVMERLRALVRQIAGFPRHLSQHVGGFIITQTPLCEMVPIENAAMPDRTVIEWDKDDVDAMGMIKVDCLGLGMLTCLSKGLGFVNQRHGGTEARRHEGGIGNGIDQDVSRSRGVAKGHGSCQGGVSSERADAQSREVWPDLADASVGGIGAVEHSRGIRQAAHRGLPSVPEDCSWLVGGVGNPARACRDAGADAGRRRRHAEAAGGGPSLAGPHPGCGADTGAEPVVPKPFVPSCLRASVPSAPLELHTIPPEEPAVYDMICAADTVGVFQIESRAQMTMLPRLRPRCFYDLVIEVAIVRPGPIQGDMVHPYLRRRNGEEAVEYPSPEVERVLAKTLGVPLFQEQAMSLAMVAAGFSAGEADRLRRAMASWSKRGGGIAKFESALIGGMLERGYTQDFAERIYRMIMGFSGYGFPESHAASFALLVYASAWLKRHHPAAFCAALLNSQPMGFYAPAQIVRDAKEHGVEALPVDVNWSGWDCGLEEGTEARRHEGTEGGGGRGTGEEKEGWGMGGPAVRLGMRLVKGLAEEDGRKIEEAVRRRSGEGQARAFTTIESLRQASGVRVRALRHLASADAFGSMGLTRQMAAWELRGLRDKGMELFEEEATERRSDEATEGITRVRLPPVCAEMEVVRDYNQTGLSLKAHPMSFVRARLEEMGVVGNGELADEAKWGNGARVKVAGLVLIRQRPGTAAGIVFVTLEDETGVANLVIFPKTYERYRAAARHAVSVVAEGKVERQGSVVHVRVGRMWALQGREGVLEGRSRDFH